MPGLLFAVTNAWGASDNPPGAWTTVISDQTFTRVYTLTSKSNVLIKDCTFRDITTTGNYGVLIQGCDNVYVLNCTFDNITTTGSGNPGALEINNSTNVVIEGCTVSNQKAPNRHSYGINVKGAAVANVTVKNCTIYNTDGNGIGTGGTSDGTLTIHDCPLPGLQILNNVIHDTGLSPDTAGNSPKHGLYVKAVDSLIEGNTIYNCFDGQGISIRSTGIVRRNQVWNTRSGTFCYWPQKPAGPSRKLIVENNLFYQTANFGHPGTNGNPHTDVRTLGINNPAGTENGGTGKFFDDFTVRFNTVVLWPALTTSATIPAIYVGDKFTNAKVDGNLICDLRTQANTPKYLSNYYGSTSTATLASNVKNYTTNSAAVFVDFANRDFGLKPGTGPAGYAAGVADPPPTDINGFVRVAANPSAGAYEPVSAGTPAFPPAAVLSNLSVRTTLAADQILIVGLTLQGTKPVLLRAAGPVLGAFGVFGAMSNPKLVLFNGATAEAANDDWAGAAILTAQASLGAFPFTAGSRDAAVLASVTGGRTVHVSGPEAGTVLFEAYASDAGPAARLVNLSARNFVGTGADVLIVGFSIAGSGPKTLLLRAAGPALGGLGVAGALADPKLELYDSAQRKIAENDDATSAARALFAAAGAFAFAPNSKDAAFLATLAPGGYTLVVSGVNAATGQALAEIFEVP